MKKKILFTFEQALLNKDFKHNRTLLKHITAYNLGEVPTWDDFTKVFLKYFVSFLSTKLSQNSVRTYCAYLKSILNDYSEYIELDSKDFCSVLSIKSVDTFNIHLTNDEVQKLLDYKPVSNTEKIVRNQFVISCLTALRYSDVIELNETNFKEDNIIYQAQKTKAIICVANSAITKRLFTDCEGKSFSLNTYNETIRDICEKAGIKELTQVIQAGKPLIGEKYKYVSSHTARRSFATNLYRETKDLVQVCRLMGHSDIKQTQRYLCINSANNEAANSYANKFKQ